MLKLAALTYGHSTEKLLLKDIDGIIVSFGSFSMDERQADLRKIISLCRENNKMCWLKLDRLYEESEIADLREYLKDIDLLGIDGVIFTDLAVNEIALQEKLSFKRMYAPETLLTNSYDIQLLLKEMDHCVISQDITLKDIKDIISEVPDRCFLRVHGPVMLAYSKRRFISAYLREDKQKYDEGYYVIEETRDNKMPLIQNTAGSRLYGGVLQSISEINELKDLKLAGVIIDDVFMDEEYDLAVIDLYNARLQGKIDKEQAQEKLYGLNENVEYIALKDVQESWIKKEEG